MLYTFIINPKAGGGLLKKGPRKLLGALRESTLDHEVLTTEYPRHAVELAREASSRSDAVVAVGGDGTVNEVVSGMVQSGASAHLAVIPAGTGNDFVKMLEVPRDPQAALEQLRDAKPARVDYGRVSWDGPSGSGSAVFINAAGTGVDADVAAAAARIRFVSGTLRYIVAVLKTLRRWTAPDMEIILSRGGDVIQTHSAVHLLALAGNGKCSAGGFYLTPNAQIDDGVLEACIVRDAPLLRILAIIPGVLRGGRHIHEPEVTLEKVDEMVVRSSSLLGIETDGEVLQAAAKVVIFQLVAGGLSILQPLKR